MRRMLTVEQQAQGQDRRGPSGSSRRAVGINWHAAIPSNREGGMSSGDRPHYFGQIRKIGLMLRDRTKCNQNEIPRSDCVLEKA
jgi:hypothetical protein